MQEALMTTPHRFGGRWTEEKLGCLRDYLNTYMTIFTQNPKSVQAVPGKIPGT